MEINSIFIFRQRHSVPEMFPAPPVSGQKSEIHENPPETDTHRSPRGSVSLAKMSDRVSSYFRKKYFIFELKIPSNYKRTD